jgi:hypothetical protein
MGNFTLPRGPCNFLDLRISPWEILFPLLLSLFFFYLASSHWRRHLPPSPPHGLCGAASGDATARRARGGAELAAGGVSGAQARAQARGWRPRHVGCGRRHELAAPGSGAAGGGGKAVGWRQAGASGWRHSAGGAERAWAAAACGRGAGVHAGGAA